MRLLLALGLALAGLAAGSAGASPAERIACGVKTLDSYFWPTGHAALPEFGLSETPTPHAEVYTGARAGTRGHQLAYLSVGRYALVGGCPEKGDTATEWGGGPMKTRRRATSKLRCTYPKRVELVVASLGDGFRLLVTLGHLPAIATVVSLRTRGARLDYDARYCKVVSAL